MTPLGPPLDLFSQEDTAALQEALTTYISGGLAHRFDPSSVTSALPSELLQGETLGGGGYEGNSLTEARVEGGESAESDAAAGITAALQALADDFSGGGGSGGSGGGGGSGE